MTLTGCLVLSAMLFCLGLFGMLVRRNIITILLSVELMVNAALINFVAFSHFGAPDPVAGSVMAVFIMALTAAEMSAALAISIAMYRQHRETDVTLLGSLRG